MNFHEKPIIYTGAVHLYVTNINVSKQYYTETIGFKILDESAQMITFTTDGENPLLIIEQPDDITSKESNKTGLYHYALLLPKRKDLGAILRHFAEQQVRIGAADHHVSEALYLNDPDGHGIEIYIDRDPSVWEWTDDQVKMTTDPLDGDGLIQEAEGTTWEGLPANTLMGHIHLHVDHLQNAQLFYENLGFNVTAHYPQALFMSDGDYHHHIAINTWSGVNAEKPSPQSARLKAYTLIYPDQATLDNVLAQLDDEVITEADHYIVHDPAGNQILLKTEM